MVPTHSRRHPWNRAVRPDHVQLRFRLRLSRILTAQSALLELGFDSNAVEVIRANALDASAWKRRPRFILTSPPYGLGIDYIRAASPPMEDPLPASCACRGLFDRRP